MPFDATPPRAGNLNASRLVAHWLFAICGMIWVMIVLGGATRLTGSGLSIMEWAPIMGTLPPMSEAEWNRLFGLYQKIPQYMLVNEGFGLEGFKRIFWLEWAHRLWGRLIGLAFVIPLFVLAWRRMIPIVLIPRLGLLFVLGGLQGAVGWFMVASGFLPDSTSVAPVRLVVHLSVALALYATILWTGLSILGLPRVSTSALARCLTLASTILAALTIVAGGFVAGTHAGLTYNTFPLMDGHLIPDGYATLTPLWRNFIENVAAVQFDHRILATLTAVVTLAAVWAAKFRGVALLMGLGVGIQYSLGVATLLHAVPVPLAVAHQGMAVLVLTAALVALHSMRRPELDNT